MSKTSTSTSARFALRSPDGRVAAWQLHVLTSPDPAPSEPLPLFMGTSQCGRDPSGPAGCHLIKVVDISMSRNHLSLVATSGARLLEVSDLASANGTWLDGVRLEGRGAARHGSVIRTGGTVYVVESSAGLWQEFDRPTVAMPGGSLEARRMRAEVHAASQTPHPCLVFGPAGTGKERASGEIHTVSRRLGRLVRIDILAVAASTLDAELFGYARDGLASSTATLAGRLRQADGGTLVLDDIADLPIEFQPTLLHWLETGKFRSLGATADSAVVVKLVACTNANLDALVAAGKFLPELAQKLRGHTVRLVPLARRTADLVSLANTVAAPSGATSWAQVLTPASVEMLALHRWPDDLRELAQVLQQLRSVAAPVAVKSLPVGLVAAVRGRPVPRPARPTDTDATQPTPTALELRKLLDRFEGDVDAVAKALGREKKHVVHWLTMAGILAPSNSGSGGPPLPNS